MSITMPAAKIIPAPLPSFKRYKKLFLKNNPLSVLRTLEYEIISNRHLQGKVLDFGGGEKAAYRKLLNCQSYDSINIDSGINPTWTIGIEETFPCPADNYDTVISFNTFEHIYNSEFPLREVYRALKRDGNFIFIVPFLYPVHGHPDDFFRATPSWWSKTLNDIGFKNIRITPLLWGPFSTGMLVSGLPGPLKSLRRHITLLGDIAYSRLRFRNGETAFDGKHGAQLNNHALGYFIEASK